jgi:hypothetical protein
VRQTLGWHRGGADKGPPTNQGAPAHCHKLLGQKGRHQGQVRDSRLINGAERGRHGVTSRPGPRAEGNGHLKASWVGSALGAS